MSAIQTFIDNFNSHELRFFIIGDETASDAEVLTAIADAPPLFESAIANWKPFAPAGDYVAAHYNPGLGMTFASKSRDSIVLPLGSLSDDLTSIGKFNLISGTKYLKNGGTYAFEILNGATKLTLQFTRARTGHVTRHIFTRLPGGQLAQIESHKYCAATGYNYEVKYENGIIRFSAEVKAGKTTDYYYNAAGTMTRKVVNGAIVKARIGSFMEELRSRKIENLYSPAPNTVVREKFSYKGTPTTKTVYKFIDPDYTWIVASD